MLLYVMRHGPAEDRAASGRDRDRALTLEGRERVRRVAAALHDRRGRAPLPRLLASPLVRARETAEIVAGVLAGPGVEVEIRDELSLDEDPPFSLAGELAAAAADALVIGHQPNVEHLVRTLLSAFPPSSATITGFSTAMVAALEPAPAQGGGFSWELRYVVDPRQLL